MHFPPYSTIKLLILLAVNTAYGNSLLSQEEKNTTSNASAFSCSSWLQQETTFYHEQLLDSQASVSSNASTNSPAKNQNFSSHTETDNKKLEDVRELNTKDRKSKDSDKKDDKPIEPAFLIPLSLDDCGYLTFKPGVRIQVRYNYERKDQLFDNTYDALDEDSYRDYNLGPDRYYNHDFFIRRFRLRGSGEAFNFVKYLVELKIDNMGRHNINPRAELENAWLDFAVGKNLFYVRVGLYDLPISRDALTSDIKLLFMDRTLIKEKLTELGLADNTIGIMLHGRPDDGRFEYAIGIFEDLKLDRLRWNSRQLMPAGRFVVNFLDPQERPDGYADYEESYIGKGKRLAIGINGAYLGGVKGNFAEEETHKKFYLSVLGGDLFFNYYRLTFQAEYDWYTERKKHGYGWYVQTGYLFFLCAELAIRYQELVPIERNEKEQWASIGMNTYFRLHHLKIQTDYTFKQKKSLDKNDHVFEIQLQLDF